MSKKSDATPGKEGGDAALYHFLESHFPQDRSKPFLILDSGKHISYGALEESVSHFKAALVVCGVKPGDRVMVQVDKSPEFVYLYLAALKSGAIFIPLNTAYTASEIKYFVQDAQPVLLICAPEKQATFESLTDSSEECRVHTLAADGSGSFPDMARTQAADWTSHTAGPDDIAVILYTSGTTGCAKGAMITQSNLISNAATLCDLWGFTADDILLHALPCYHAHGLFVALHCALASGSRVRFMAKFDAGRVLDALPDVTVMMGVPTFYVRLLDRPDFTAQSCAQMRLFISGSAPLLAETHTAFTARSGHRILERYGMTEAGMITSNLLDGERVPGTVGFALPGVTIRKNAHEVLEIKGPNVFKGYWKMPDKTAESFTEDGFFITDDLVSLDDDGRVTIIGRAKDLIISGGFNVYPKEVEMCLNALEGIYESAVVAACHPDFGEAVVAVVVRESGSRIDEDGILTALKNQLASFKQPKRVFFVDALPRNAMGKVQKNILRENFKNSFTEPKIKLVCTDGIGRILIQNEKHRNAISMSMWKDFAAAAHHLAQNETIRVIIIRGAGTMAFASGADLGEFSGSRKNAEQAQEYAKLVQQALAALAAIRVPVIAQLHGYCVGAGTAIALACDVRYGDDRLKFGVPAARLGIGYDPDWIKRMVDIIGAAYATEILLTGQLLGSEDALNSHFVTRILPSAELEGHVEDMASLMAANAPLSLQASKKALREIQAFDRDRDWQTPFEWAKSCDHSEDYKQALMAFRQKEKPEFQGK